MTQTQAPAGERVSEELAPCPFCNDPMEQHFDVIRHVNQGDCVIGAYAWPDSRKADWNRRADLALSCIEPLPSSTADAGRVGELEAALRNIAEGNLGDASWQANYDRIRQVARLALQGGSDA